MAFCMYSLLCVCMHLHLYVCLHMSVLCGCFHVVCVSVGELFHVVHNEIRPTPCSLLSGLYLSNRLVQVISFLWILVRWGSARSTNTVSCRRERRGQTENDKKKCQTPSAHFKTKIWFQTVRYGDLILTGIGCIFCGLCLILLRKLTEKILYYVFSFPL